MPKKNRKVTETQWAKAAEEFELGLKHGAQIARELGVSRQTVSEQFRKRGCVKASRVSELIAPLEAELNEKARQRATMQSAREEAAARRSAEIDVLMDRLMRSIIAAAKNGNISDADSTIREVGKAMGVKLVR
jgi:hypothetical protein